MTISKRSLVLACLACVAVGWWLSTSPSSPVGPKEPDRPFLRFVAKAAKAFLWLAIVAEGPPPEASEPQFVRARVGSDGYRQLEHGRGW